MRFKALVHFQGKQLYHFLASFLKGVLSVRYQQEGLCHQGKQTGCDK